MVKCRDSEELNWRWDVIKWLDRLMCLMMGHHIRPIGLGGNVYECFCCGNIFDVKGGKFIVRR